MKRLALIAAVVGFAACAAKEEAPVVDTTAPAAAVMDSMADSMHVDSLHADSSLADTGR